MPSRAASAFVAVRQLPAGFTGDMLCADCQRIRHRLNLVPDQSFYLGMIDVGTGEGASPNDIGTRILSSNQKVLVLTGGREASTLCRIADPKTLRKLYLEGRDIDRPLRATCQSPAYVAPAQEPRISNPEPRTRRPGFPAPVAV